MGMDTVEQCIQRVSQRVRAGGHKVTVESIEYNFLHGYKNLFEYFRLFDSVTLLDSSIAENTPMKIPEKLLLWKKGKIRLFKETYPWWVGKFIAENNE